MTDIYKLLEDAYDAGEYRGEFLSEDFSLEDERPCTFKEWAALNIDRINDVV